MSAAVETFELSKDYRVGFWRPRPYRALDKISFEVEPGGVFGFLGPEWRREDDHTQAADAARVSHVGIREDSRQAGRRRGRQAADRLPAGESLLLRQPDRRGAARLLRQPLRLSRRGAAQARLAPPRRGRHRRRTPAAIAQIFQGDDSARRAGPGDRQRPRGRVPRRTDVRARSARPPRSASVDPAAARRRPHRLLQLAHPGRRRSAVQPDRDCRQGPSDGHGRSGRHSGRAHARLGNRGGWPRRAAGHVAPRLRHSEGDEDRRAALRARSRAAREAGRRRRAGRSAAPAA